MTPRELARDIEIHGLRFEDGSKVPQEQTDFIVAQLNRAALPEQPLSKEWREQADEHDRAANNMGSAMYGGIQAAVLRGCADALDAQHDDGREFMQRLEERLRARYVGATEDIDSVLVEFADEIRKHLGGDSDEA